MSNLVSERLSKSYVVDYDDVLKYYQTNKNLHALEGFWKLSCNQIYFNNNLIEENDFNISLTCWAIVYQDGIFYVCDFGKNYFNDINFKATFRIQNNFKCFDYQCDFYKSEWRIKAQATLINNQIITYGYFVDKIYFDYELDKDVFWNFIWTKTNNFEIN